MFDTAPYEKKINSVIDRFHEELKKVRTGRAHISMLDGIQVEAYGTLAPLNQVANITAPEPQLLMVTPYDPSHLDEITTAIRNAHGLGFNPSDDGRVVRVPVPTLTEERRREMVKLTTEKGEEAKIALRTIRQEAFKDIKALKESKEISEDDQKRIEKEIDKIMSETQDKIDQDLKEKEADILKV